MADNFFFQGSITGISLSSFYFRVILSPLVTRVSNYA